MTCKTIQFIRLALLVAMAIFCAACSENSSSKDRDWQLVWEDEFEGQEGQLINSSKWGYDIGTDWGNSQLEYDTDRAENVSLDGNGNLAIITRKENYMGSAYTSARISTRGLFETTYGRFEARIQLPWGQGIWPAFWLLGNNVDEVSWPECGEIDIMEYRGQQPSIIHGTIHGPGYSAGGGITQSFELTQDRFDTGFHEFAVEWGEDFIEFFVDDKHYQTITPGDLTGNWVFDHPFYIILNVAVGGGYVGPPNANTQFPQTMLVDWVRVYEEK